MRKAFINLNQTAGGIIPYGWTASVAIAQGATGQNQVAIGESIIYNSKQQAWDTIRNHAENLDYQADEIFFNYRRVDSFVTVEQMVQVL
jgi:hypothetical protein